MQVYSVAIWTNRRGEHDRDRRVIPQCALFPFISLINTYLDLHQYFWQLCHPSLKRSATRRVELLLAEATPNSASVFYNFRR
uniref:Uncharacterized protein n=1 Tax=Solanum tuberosum TaxID=4113 RepID=M1DVS4_SOLTU